MYFFDSANSVSLRFPYVLYAIFFRRIFGVKLVQSYVFGYQTCVPLHHDRSTPSPIAFYWKDM